MNFIRLLSLYVSFNNNTLTTYFYCADYFKAKLTSNRNFDHRSKKLTFRNKINALNFTREN